MLHLGHAALTLRSRNRLFLTPTDPLNCHFSFDLPPTFVKSSDTSIHLFPPTPTRMPHVDPVELTAQLVRIPSVNPALEEGGQGEAQMAERTAEWLESWGFRTETPEVAPGRFNVVARRGPEGGPRLLLNGHTDTVGVAGMEAPFSGAIRDGRLYGRGACDMKAGVAAALAAAAELGDLDLKGELVVALTADEEHASLGMQHLVASGMSADGAIVCEPTGLAVMPAHKGFLWVDFLVHGRAAHGSRPDVGVDAIVHTGSLLTVLAEEGRRLEAQPPHPLLGHGSIHAGTIRGGTAPSVYPEECSLTVERRTLPGESREGLLAEVNDMVARAREGNPDLAVDVSPGLFRAGTEVPTSGPLVTDLVRSLEAVGSASRIEGMTAWVDACFLNQAGTPALCFGPGSIAQAHGLSEWVDVEEIRTCRKVLVTFSRRLLT